MAVAVAERRLPSGRNPACCPAFRVLTPAGGTAFTPGWQVRPPLRGLLKVLQGSHPGNALLNMQRHLVRCTPLCGLGARQL